MQPNDKLNIDSLTLDNIIGDGVEVLQEQMKYLQNLMIGVMKTLMMMNINMSKKIKTILKMKQTKMLKQKAEA
jgi:hypothetical protein